MSTTTKKIYVSLGNERYVGGTVIATDGKDISTATFTIATVLGQTDPEIPPAAASFSVLPSDVFTQGVTVSEKKVRRLIDTAVNYPAGDYGCWVRVADLPEIEPFLLQVFTTA